VSESTAARLRVGAELRRLRTEAGLSGEQVASALGWSQPKVSRIEAGRVAHSVGDVAALLGLVGAAEDVRAELLATVAQESGEPAWLVRAGGPSRRQGSLAAMETAAATLRQYVPGFVPGLLQTQDYAVAVARASGVPNPRSVASTRMQRQAAVREAGTQLQVVMDARGLLVSIPEDETLLAEQLGRLIASVEEPHVDLRVVPLGAQVVALSPVPFTIYDFRREVAGSVVYVETPTADLFVAAASDLDRYVSLWKSLRASALDRDGTVRYLRSIHEAVLAGRWPRQVTEGLP
jgi:transcriptional regulator with XRE-family HTH domain